jgi:arsenate reductase-like glutaredoxin family protein
MTIIEKVKALLSKHDIDPKSLLEEATKLADAILSTGETIQTEGEWAVGSAAMLVTEDGSMPLPEGPYVLEDGTKFTVDVDGIILEWVTAEEQMTSVLTEEKVAEMIKSAVSAMTDEFKKAQSSNKETETEAKLSALQKDMEKLLSKPEAFSSKKPVPTVSQKEFKNMTAQERIMHKYNTHKK